MIRIDLAFPPAGLSPNDREDWHVKAKAAKQYRYDCGIDATNAKNAHLSRTFVPPYKLPLEGHATVTITFVLTSMRRRDFDNLIASFKAGMDGIVDAGILRDDSVWCYTPTYRVELGKKPAVRVEVTG
jgi:crossover junction endodeoxyribonuclease RusA